MYRKHLDEAVRISQTAAGIYRARSVETGVEEAYLRANHQMSQGAYEQLCTGVNTTVRLGVVYPWNRVGALKYFFWRTHVLFGGHWYPCFGFVVTSSLGFKARVGSVIFTCFVEANVKYIPQDPPLVLYVPTSLWPAAQLASSHITRTEDERATIVPATRLYSSTTYRVVLVDRN